MRAVAAAWAMARRLPPPLRMGYAARAYVMANDAAHRGSVLTRLRREVLVRLPATPQPARARQSSWKTFGLSSR